MLKRLFISLIILSALTSDGAADLSGNLYKICSEIEGDAEVLRAVYLLLAEMPAEMRNGMELSLRESQDGFVVVSMNDIINKKNQATGIHIPEAANIRLMSTFFSNTESVSIFVKDKRSVFEKSDNSPPLRSFVA